MTAAATPSATPKLSAEQVLTRLLDLIRNSKSVREFTPEHLSKTMGVEFVTYEPGYHVFSEELTPEWGYRMEMHDSVTTARIRRFDFSFNSDPGTSSSIAAVCQLDFDQFAAALEAMGFTRQSYYDSPPQPPPGEKSLPHGQWMYDYFDRPGMRVQVSPEWGADPSLPKGGRDCVKMVLIS